MPTQFEYCPCSRVTNITGIGVWNLHFSNQRPDGCLRVFASIYSQYRCIPSSADGYSSGVLGTRDQRLSRGRKRSHAHTHEHKEDELTNRRSGNEGSSLLQRKSRLVTEDDEDEDRPEGGPTQRATTSSASLVTRQQPAAFDSEAQHKEKSQATDRKLAYRVRFAASVVATQRLNAESIATCAHWDR